MASQFYTDGYCDYENGFPCNPPSIPEEYKGLSKESYYRALRKEYLDGWSDAEEDNPQRFAMYGV